MDLLFNIPQGDIIYDIETFPNVFTLSAYHTVTKDVFQFEMSNRRNDYPLLFEWLKRLKRTGCRMVGYNNLAFDHPVLEYVVTFGKHVTPRHIYEKAQSYIFEDSFRPPWMEEIIPQIDLLKIHHFDNKNKMTSLKTLEFNMLSESVQELPFPPGETLSYSQIDVLLKYNLHDVMETYKFYLITSKAIEFRTALSQKMGKSVLNLDDVKIGEYFIIHRLEQSIPGCCYKNRKKNQTIRGVMKVGDVILPYLKGSLLKFSKALESFQALDISPEGMGGKKIVATVPLQGVDFDFALGGLHASVTRKECRADNGWMVEDWDVTSYYPNIALVNGFYPEHLTEKFCEVYRQIYEERKKFPDKTSLENKTYKFALNGVYGKSKSIYSPLYDPLYALKIVVNGQLSLALLIETLLKSGLLKIIQANTDGITFMYHESQSVFVKQVHAWWQSVTGLNLEIQSYSKIFVRDVNNYIAQYTNGKVKRKGAYEWDRNELEWSQDHSGLIIPLAAEKFLLENVPVEETIMTHTNKWDFFMRLKIPRSMTLLHGGEPAQNTCRYYVSKKGKPFVKVIPPKGSEEDYKRKNGISDLYYQQILSSIPQGEWDERIHTKNKSKYKETKTGIHVGYVTTICNNLAENYDYDFDYDFYISEAKKLIDGFTKL